MKHFDYLGRQRPSPQWTKLAAASVLAVAALAGCGGGSDGAPGATGAAGAAGAAGATGPQGPAGANFVATVNVGSNSATPSAAAVATWQALQPQVTVTSVAINSPPVVKFKLTDQNGNPVVGLGAKTQSSTATVGALANISFTLAKLVPATSAQVTSGTTTSTISTEPSKWVSYIVTKPVTVAQAAGTIAAADSCNNTATTAATWCGTFPAADNQGTLVDNGDGSYQYTFYRDVKAVAAVVASLNDSADGLSKKADLGDLTYDGSLTHRLGIFISGNMPGTGTNTPTAAASSVAAVPLVNTFNLGYDFVPNGGTPAVTRKIVDKASCTACHDGKGIGHASPAPTSFAGAGASLSSTAGTLTAGRNDPNLCVTCHTDQIKYSFNAGNMTFAADGITIVSAASSASTAVKRAAQAILYGRPVGVYPSLIHKTHMGDNLVLQGYNFNNNGGAQMFNKVGFPQDPANCTKCHTGTASTSGGNTIVTPNGDNWKNVPSLLACGACHDGINFATGAGITLADRDKDVAAKVAVGTTKSGHTGGVKADNTTCALCHDATTIPVSHRTTFATPNNPVAQAGVATFSFGITSVTVNSSRQPVVTFQIKKNGVAVTSLAVPTLVRNAASGAMVVSPAYEPIPGFASGPSIYVAYAVPQDGIPAPADFNVSASASLTNLLIAAGSPKAGTLTADAAGNFTVTLTGDTIGQPVDTGCTKVTAPALQACNPTAILASPVVIPTTATMVTGAIIGSFTQKGLTAYPYVAANVAVNPNVSATGGLATPGVLKKLVATGYTARRVIVDIAKCNSCHDQLGTNPNFHGAARNDPTACNICHNVNRVNTGWAVNSSTFVHGIHGASKRSVAYTWNKDWSQTLYPGVLKDCNQCHVANTVNFGASGATLQPNLLWPYNATGTTVAPVATTSPYIAQTAGTKYGLGFAFTAQGATVASYTLVDGTVVPAKVAGAGGYTRAAENTTLMSSPIASACFACHDTSLAKAHMVTNGGAVYEARSTALSKTEGCLVCHGAGKEFDVAVVHQ